MSALDNLAQCLSQCSHHNNTIRQAAEANLRNAGTTSGFGQALVIVALNQNRSIQARQQSILYLKLFLKEYWHNGENCRFTSTEKNFIRSNLLQGLQDSSRLMRTAFGLCIAKIAQDDFPEQWPDLFDHLLSGIDSGNPVLILGVVRCMSLFCDWLDDITIPKLAPRLFPTLTRIISDDVSFGPQTRRYASSVVKTCVVLLSHLRGNPDMPAFQVLAQGTQAWLTPLLNTLTPESYQRQEMWYKTAMQNGSIMAEDPSLVHGYGVQIESLQSMSVLLGELHSLLGPNETTRVFMSIWKFTETLIPIYIHQIINPNNNNNTSGTSGTSGATQTSNGNDVNDTSLYDAEGNGIGIDVLMVQIFEFLNAVAVVPSKNVRQLMKQGMTNIFQACVLVIQMTQEQTETWQAGGIGGGSEDDSMGALELGDLHVRNVAAVLVYELMESFTSESLIGASQSFHFGSKNSNERRAKGDANWWKPLEASLLVVGIVSTVVEEQQEQNASQLSQSSFDTNAILKTALELIHAPEHVPPVLWSRSLWLLGRYSWALTTEQGSTVFQIAVAALNNSNSCIAIKMTAMRALIELQTHIVTRNDASQLYMATIEGTCNLLAVTPTESLPVVVSALSNFIKFSSDGANGANGTNGGGGGSNAATNIASVIEPHLTPILVNVWSANASNPYLCETIVDVFQSIASNPSALPGLQLRLLPTLCNLVGNHTTNISGVVEYALDLMTVISRSMNGTELSIDYLNVALPCVLNFMQTSEDNAGLCSGTNCLSAIVYAAPTNLKNCHNGAAVENMLSVISRLLSVTFSQQGAIRVGSLGMQLMKCCNDSITTETMTQLVQAMVVRLDHSTTIDLTESIVVFFARLMHLNLNTIVTLLTSMTITCKNGSTKSGFVILMERWTMEQPSFSGKFQVKVTLLALASLYTSYGTQIASIQVNGDIKIDVSEKRRTRSQGKKKTEYVIVPLPLKMVTLLLRAVDEPEEAYGEEEEEGMSGNNGNNGGGSMSSGIFAPAEDFEEFMLSDMGGPGFWDDEEEDDGNETMDIVEDPLYLIDLQKELLNFFKARSIDEMNGLGNALGHEDQQRLVGIGQLLLG